MARIKPSDYFYPNLMGRIYLEAMEEILSNVDSKIVIDESIRGLLPLLDLGSTGPLPATQKGGAR